MTHHFLDLPGASTVKTTQYQLTRRLVPELVEHAAIGAVYGEAGNGKTFSVDAALVDVTVQTVTITSLRRPTMKYIALSVLEKMTGVRHTGDLMRLTEDIFVELAGERRLIVIDEAQNLSTECFEYLRHLHDDPTTNFALLFIGGNRCWDVIERHPMLRSRVWHKVEFKPLTNAEVLKVIPRYHPVYKDAEAALLLEIDEDFAHGNFRDWAAFTKTSLTLCREHNIDSINREIVDGALTLHRGGVVAQAA